MTLLYHVLFFVSDLATHIYIYIYIYLYLSVKTFTLKHTHLKCCHLKYFGDLL